MKTLILALSVSLLLAACAPTLQKYMIKEQATPGEYDSVRWECLSQSREYSSDNNIFGRPTGFSASTNEDLYNACFKAHGWRVSYEPKGSNK
jgi:hypothetical protein